ncbi:MAG TPA: hypothetical protein VFA11_04005 [Acidimicrobiales bacterium]|nr:hypothetical protein [Acidimicrobiales bacterium]
MRAPLAPPPVFDAVVGQPRAVEALAAAASAPVHAYLLVGPAGSGKREAAVAFAAALLCAEGGCGACEHCRRALGRSHPDLVMVERTGASISVDEARDIIRVASRTPVEADRKVLVLTDFHLVSKAGPALLKTIEEPPATTVFVVLAESVPPELVTIASRCVRVDFSPLSSEALEAVLAAEGVDASTARSVAAAAGGRLDRARLLVSDEGFAARREAWRSVPSRLDGTGATIVVLADELLAGCDAAVEPLARAQKQEATRAAEEAKARGERFSSKEMEDRHRRQQRRVRTDELRAGLAALVDAYRPRMAGAADARDVRAAVEAIGAVEDAGRALIRNPNETLLLQALLVRLDGLGRR